MGLDNYLLKASRNCRAGTWAEEQSFFDVAVSRHYYCLYEKAIYIQKSKNLAVSSAGGANSHYTFINELREHLKDKLSPEETACFAGFNQLTSIRNIADYKEQCLEDANAYKLSFKWSFNQINATLDRLIGK